MLTLVQPIETMLYPCPGPRKTTHVSTPTPPPPKKVRGNATKEMAEPHSTPTCALYDIQGHATQKFLDLTLLHTHMDAMGENDSVPAVTILDPRVVKNKSLRTNHPCVVCDLYGHYSHHFSDLPEYQSTLRDLQKHSCESDVTILKEIHPLVSSPDITNTIYTISSSNSAYILSHRGSLRFIYALF